MPVRKIPKTYRSITGRFPSVVNCRCIHYESAVERDFFLSLEFDPTVLSYEEQPIRITGIDNGKSISYTPDCLVKFKDGKPSRLVEIKYLEELREKEHEFAARFKLGRDHCEKSGMEFHIIDDIQIRQAPLDNYRLLYRFAKPPQNLAANKPKVLAVLSDSGPIELAGLLKLFSPDRVVQAAFTPIIWHLLFTREILTDLSSPLSNQSIIRTYHAEKHLL